LRLGVWGVGFMFQGSGIRVWVLGFRVQCSGFSVQGFGSMIQDLAHDLGCGFRNQGSGFWVFSTFWV